MATKNIVGHLVYKVTGDSKELDTSLKGSQDRVAKFSKFVMSALGIGGAVIAIRGLIRIGKDLVAAYAVQEKAEASLSAAIRATGGDVDNLMEQYKTFASGIQDVTTVGDEQTLGLLQQAESLGIARDKMREAAQGAIGLSKAFGIDMNTALRGIALAYEGNYAQLSRYIPALRTASDEAERQAILQEAMANGFQIARAEAETSTGAMLQLQNAIGDLKEQGGRALADFMHPAVEWLTQIVEQAVKATAEMTRLRELVKEAQRRELTTAEQLEVVSLQLAKLERERLELQRQSAEAAAITGVAFEEQTNQEIESLKQQQRALTDAMRWEAKAQDERKRGNAEAAAAAEAEAIKQRDLAEWIKEVNAAHAKTPEGQRKILDAEIARWEYWLPRSEIYKQDIQDYLNLLYKQRDAEVDAADTWKENIDAMTAETEAAMDAYQLRLDAELAYEQESARIRAEAAAEEIRLAAEVAAHKQQVEQAAMDFMVNIWSQIDSINSARASRELEQMRRQHDLELEGFEGTEEEKKALAEDFRKEEANLEYKAALQSWKFQLVGAVAAAARAIIESMKLGFPWAIPMVAMATIQSGIQIAAIGAAKPVPAYAEGVDMIVPPGYPNDSYLFRAESGEHLQVTPGGEGRESPPIHIIVQLGSHVLYDDINRASDNGLIRINPKSIKR